MASVQELKQELLVEFLTCDICRQAYLTTARSPRRLPCSHVACEICLQQATTGNDVQCRQCQPKLLLGKDAILPERVRLKLLEVIQEESAKPTESTQQTQAADASSSPSELLLWRVQEMLLTCNICSRPFLQGERSPVILPCQHDLCSRCVHKMATSGALRCPSCRGDFSLREAGRPDPTLVSLMSWLQRHTVHFPALSDSQVSAAERMYSLQELLQEKEEKLVSGTFPRGVMEVESQEFLLRFQEALGITVPSHSGLTLLQQSPANREEAFKELAEACMQAVTETYQDCTGAREVRTTTRVALDKLRTHSSKSEKFCKVLGDEGCVQLLTSVCQHQAGAKMENTLEIVKTAMVVLRNIASVREGEMGQHFMEAKTVETVCAFVREDLVDEGVVKEATFFLFKVFFAGKEHRAAIADTLTQSKYPEMCLEIIMKREEKLGHPGSSKWLQPTLNFIYSTFWNYTAVSPTFAKALAAAGAVEHLAENLRRRNYLDEISNEECSFLVIDSLQILINMQEHAEEEVLPLLIELNVNEAAVNLVKPEYIEKQVTSKALTLLLTLYYFAKNKKEMADHLARLGLPGRCVDIMREVHRLGPFDTETVSRVTYLLYKVLWSPSYNSSLFSQGLEQAGAVAILEQDCLRGSSTHKIRNSVFEAAVNVLENMSRFPETRKCLVKRGTTRTLMGLVEEENEGRLMTIISLLAETAEADEDIRVLMEHVDRKGTVATLLQWLEAAVDRTDRRWTFSNYSGYFPLVEIVELLSRLAQLHPHKSKVLHDSLPPVCCRLLDDGVPEERGHVTSCLLALAQDSEVRARLAQNEALTSRLQAVEEATPCADVTQLLSLLGTASRKT